MKIYFDDKNGLLTRLSKADMPIPNEVIDYMRNHIWSLHERKDALVGIIDIFEGKFVERVFAFKHDNRKKEPLKYQEIVRQVEGLNHKLVKNYHIGNYCYTIIWPETKSRNYCGYYYNNYYKKEFELEYACYTNSCSIYLTTFIDCVEMNQSIKYCGFEYTKKNMYAFIEYISQYRIFPQIEMYSKNGINYLSTDTRFYKKFSKSKEFSMYVRTNLKYIQDNKPNYPNILQGFRSGDSLQVYLSRKQFLSSTGYSGNESILTKNVVDKIIQLYENSYIYLDYFNAAKHLIYMDTAKALFPENLQEAHDYYVEKYNEQRDKIKYEAFLKVSKDWEWLNWNSKKFMIMVAPSKSSLVNEGQSLHHCVGYMDYDKRMADGGNLILFVRKVEVPEEPFYTVEYDKENKRIVQIHGDHNISATPEVDEFIAKWLSKIPQLKAKKEMVYRAYQQETALA